MEHWLEREIAPPHEGSIRRPIAPWANALTTELHLAPNSLEYDDGASKLSDIYFMQDGWENDPSQWQKLTRPY